MLTLPVIFDGEGPDMKKQVKQIVMTALFMALCCTATMVIHVPSPTQGFVNLGDCMVLLSGWLLGPWYGFLAAGLGSAFYDLTNPAYVMEAPITLVTKGMYGLVAGLVLYYIFKDAKEKYAPQLLATICAAAAYMAAYLVKNYFYNAAIQELTEPVQRWALVVSKIPATVTNGVIAAIFAPILGVALMKALRAAHVQVLTP